jgi:hypothetical protein
VSGIAVCADALVDENASSIRHDKAKVSKDLCMNRLSEMVYERLVRQRLQGPVPEFARQLTHEMRCPGPPDYLLKQFLTKA